MHCLFFFILSLSLSLSVFLHSGLPILSVFHYIQI